MLLLKMNYEKEVCQVKEIFPSLIKNERLRQTLSQKLSHAYIIEGASGSGRMTAVRNCAAALLCENRDDPDSSLPCGKCSVCSRISRGIHPDVIEFSSGTKKSIGVDTARELRSQVFISPVESEYKFFVIRDADLMTPEAQNALLISIEEPPPFSVFFLIAEDKSLLLETIRSRCVILTTEKLDDDTVAEYLRKLPEGDRLYAADPDKFTDIVKSADGSLGEGIRLLTDGVSAADEAYTAVAELVRCVLTGSPVDKVQLASAFPKTRDMQEKVFTLAVSAVRDIIAIKLKTDAAPVFYKSSDEAVQLSSVPLRKLMAFYSVLEDGRLALSGNSSPSLTAERIIMMKF